MNEEIGRRSFLERAGAGFAFAGLAACTRAPKQKIVPYAVQPPEIVPGLPLHYATAFTMDGYATGVIVESHQGRPTKIEGNPDHPASRGATTAYEQAQIASLYDPERAHAVTRAGVPSTWSVLAAEVRDVVTRGRGVHVVLPPTSSPSVVALLETLRARLPDTRVWFHAPMGRDQAWSGARLAFGRALDLRLDLKQARVILALDADVLGVGPSCCPDARAFADGRRQPRQGMNRLYAVEAAPSVTGSTADHRLAVRSGEIVQVAAAIAAEVLGAERFRGLAARHSRFIRAVARDLLLHRGASLVIAGHTQPPEVHVLAHAMNDALGNAGRAVSYAPSPILEAGEASHDLRGLAHDLEGGGVELLAMLGIDPVATAFADIAFGPLMRRARRTLCLTSHENATSRACTWFAPEAHPLEAWGDTCAFDGTVSIVQPLIAPLFGGKTALDILALTVNDSRDAHEIARSRWEAVWQSALRAGVVDTTALSTEDAPLRADVVANLVIPLVAETLEIDFRADARLYDGRFAHNHWLRELPDPITKLTWDTAVLLGPGTAARLGIRNEDVVEIARSGRTARMPALIVRGHAEEVLTAPLAYTLRTSDSPWSFYDARVSRTGERIELAITQGSSSLEGRQEHIILHASLAEYLEHPHMAEPLNRRPLMLYQEPMTAPHQWGMAIDLNACTGCSACVIACQAENNVPVVGKGEVRKGRAMHWLRIDRYIVTSPRAEDPVFQPMLCQHCEKAPCEYVCPVAATVHSSDGLNQMVYNRCVGTRFCSNNCPYKVRRFNWFDYHDGEPRERELGANPEVTVRARGVMEKCTYCVQRIRLAEQRAAVEGRGVVDGEVRTACEQACPTGAIVFGDLADRSSRVARAQGDPRAYAALNDLGTVPRTRYLARVRNYNPELA